MRKNLRQGNTNKCSFLRNLRRQLQMGAAQRIIETMPKTILAIGAHCDDCVFGIPGILLQAARKHYRVVLLSLIGDYTNWAPVMGREKEFVQGTIDISKEYGAEMRYLKYASPRSLFWQS